MTDFKPSDELLALRKEIDHLDQALAEMLCQRLLLIHQAAPLKEKAAHVHLEDRIEEIITKIRPVADRFHVSADYLEKIYRLMIDESIASEMKEWQRLNA